MLRVLCAFDELGLAGPQSGPVARTTLLNDWKPRLLCFPYYWQDHWLALIITIVFNLSIMPIDHRDS